MLLFFSSTMRCFPPSASLNGAIYNEIHKAIANHEIDMKKRQATFDVKLEMKRKLVEDELEANKRAGELKELDLSQLEDLLQKREYKLEVQSRKIIIKEKDLADLSALYDEKEKSLRAAEKEVELNKTLVQRQKEEITMMKLDLDNSLNSLEDKKQQLDCSNKNFELFKTKKSELSIMD